MTAPEGGFYSAEDADSVIDPEEPSIKGEGAYYIWSEEEVRRTVPGPEGDWFCYRFGVAESGNVANDPHQEFTGRNILYQAMTLEETARQFDRTVEEVASGLARASAALLEERSRRVRPHLDDKILTAWNGLMISSFALGGAVFGEPRYREAARRAAEFLAARMYDPSTGLLLRRYRGGEAAIPGFLEDYAGLAEALLDLYEAQFDIRHLELAVKLTEKQLALFEDRERGGFFSTAGDASLVLRAREEYDGAEPCGNSLALLNLLRLSQITGRADFREAAERTLAAFAPRLSGAPVSLPRMLSACEFLLGDPRQIVLSGDRNAADTAALLRTFYSRFVSNRVVLLVDSPAVREKLAKGIPAIASMLPENGRAAAWVCRNFTCQLPVSETEKFAELLQ